MKNHPSVAAVTAFTTILPNTTVRRQQQQQSTTIAPARVAVCVCSQSPPSLDTHTHTDTPTVQWLIVSHRSSGRWRPMARLRRRRRRRWHSGAAAAVHRRCRGSERWHRSATERSRRRRRQRTIGRNNNWRSKCTWRNCLPPTDHHSPHPLPQRASNIRRHRS